MIVISFCAQNPNDNIQYEPSKVIFPTPQSLWYFQQYKLEFFNANMLLKIMEGIIEEKKRIKEEGEKYYNISVYIIDDIDYKEIEKMSKQLEEYNEKVNKCNDINRKISEYGKKIMEYNEKIMRFNRKIQKYDDRIIKSKEDDQIRQENLLNKQIQMKNPAEKKEKVIKEREEFIKRNKYSNEEIEETETIDKIAKMNQNLKEELEKITFPEDSFIQNYINLCILQTLSDMNFIVYKNGAKLFQKIDIFRDKRKKELPQKIIDLKNQIEDLKKEQPQADHKIQQIEKHIRSLESFDEEIEEIYKHKPIIIKDKNLFVQEKTLTNGVTCYTCSVHDIKQVNIIPENKNQSIIELVKKEINVEKNLMGKSSNDQILQEKTISQEKINQFNYFRSTKFFYIMDRKDYDQYLHDKKGNLQNKRVLKILIGCFFVFLIFTI